MKLADKTFNEEMLHMISNKEDEINILISK